MKTTILKQSLLLLSSATLLAACGGDGGDSPIDDGGANPGESGNQSLLYSYPDDGQSEIATRAPIVLRFSSRVSTGQAEQNIILRREADGTELGFSAEEVPGERRGVVLQPDEELDPHTRYVIDVQGLPLARGPSADREIEFSTRALQRGPKNLVTTDSDFKLSRTFPSGGEQEPVMDFSTFRFQFTQPIDPATARYGQGGDATVTLTDSEGNLIDAALLVDGPYMTVDPEPEHLDTKTEYTLTLGSGLSSTFEQDFTGDNGVITFTPKDSSPRGEPTIMVQRITEAVKPSGEPNRSELTGAPVNEVPVNSTLLGEDSATRSSGDVRAELADVTQYTEVTPVRIPRSTILTGTNIDVMIGGAVPAGISSGAVKMHFLSDATGYLVPNPYADNRDDALRIVRLFMDVAISTENAEANGGFTQDILHIELIGTAEVDPQAGVLNLDAVSVVEPDVLGQEFAYGLLSFQLQSYKDQNNPPAEFADTTPPTLQSWTLADNTAEGGPDKTKLAKPGDPIILNFSEPLDRQSVVGKVHLYKTEGGVQTELSSGVYMDGSALVIKPSESLTYSKELSPVTYQLTVDAGVMDLSGNLFTQPVSHNFSLADVVEQRYPVDRITGEAADTPEAVPVRSAQVLGLYPGYPCALNPNTLDLQNEIVGRCLGSIPAEQDLPLADQLPVDDSIPLPKLPSNRPIVVSFSKDISPESVQYGTTFTVEKIDTDGNTIANVDGNVTLKKRILKFVPDVAWEDGTLYRYTLMSNGDITSAEASCSPETMVNASICDTDGYPLQTQLLSNIELATQDPEFPSVGLNALPYHAIPQSIASLTGGGPNLVQYFKGAERSSNVLQVLKTAPTSDRNANLFTERSRRLETNEFRTGVSWSDELAIDNEYDIEETGPSSAPDMNTESLTDNTGFLVDEGGVKPAANSAKILSSSFGVTSLTEAPRLLNSGATRTLMVGGNTGCGFEEAVPFPDQSLCTENSGFFDFDKTCYMAKPTRCPQDKFTYLNSTLFAEVTDRYVDGKGLLVHIFPGHVLTTSFKTVLKRLAQRTNSEITESGYQVMRMRFNGAERDEPIRGYIFQGENGPVFNAKVDLYLDAPRLAEELTSRGLVQRVFHNFYSYPVSLTLSGPVKFLDDGRMVIEQYNINRVDFNLRSNAPESYVDLFIPKKGSYLKYISQPVK